MVIVRNDGFTFVHRCGNRMWYVGRVAQTTEPASVSHPFDARYKRENSDWQGDDLLKGGFAVVSSLRKVRRVIESKNIKLV
jgi:hypothetical protein